MDLKLPKKSIDPALLVGKGSSGVWGAPMSSQETPQALRNIGVAQPATRKPVAFAIDPQELIKPVIPVKEVIQTPQQVMKPMSQELPATNPRTLPNGQPIIAGNVSPQSMQSQPERKYLTRDKVKTILMNAPEGVDKSTLLDDIVGQGYIVEGYNDGEALATRGAQAGAPQRVAPQISYGENKIDLLNQQTPAQGGLRRGVSGLSTDMGSFEWLNPVGKLTTDLNNKVQSIKPVSKKQIAGAFNTIIPGFGDFVVEGGGPNVAQMIANIPQSLLKTASATAQGITNPVDTLEGLVRLVGTDEGHKILKDRYGSIDNFARSMEQDPVGVASDALTVVQGGAGIASKGARFAGATQFADDAARLSAQAGGAADLGLGVGINKINAGIGNIASKPLRIAAKTALAPTQPLVAGKEVLGGVVNKERADKMLSNMNRITKPQQEKFAEMAGETVGEFLNNRGIVEGGDKAISKIANKFVESIDKADKGLEAIRGEYKDEFLSLMANEAADFAENTLSPEATRIRQLATKADTKGLTMTESNELKRFYQRNNKFTYGKDITAGEKTIRATNIDNAVRKRQFDIAEQNGFSNLKQINKETQAFKYLLDKLSKNEAGRLGNNAMGLTDWIVAGQVAIDPSSIALLVGKKVAESNWFRSNVVKIINKLSGHQNKGDLTLDLGKIQGIQTEKDLNKYLALPLKENVTSPTLNTMNRADGNQGAIVGTNAVVSPKPKVTSNTVIEKGVANKPGTTKIDPKAIVKQMGEQIKAKKQVTSMPLKNQIDRIDPKTGEGFDKNGKSLGIVDKNAAKRGETPVKTAPKTTETKIEPKNLDNVPDKKTIEYYDSVNKQWGDLKDQDFRNNVETLTYDEFENMSPILRKRYDKLLEAEILQSDDFNRNLSKLSKEVQNIEEIEKRIGKVGKNTVINKGYIKVQEAEWVKKKERLIERISEETGLDQFEASNLYDDLTNYDNTATTKGKITKSIITQKEKGVTEKVNQELQNIAKKVKEKSIAKKENGSIMDGMKTTNTMSIKEGVSSVKPGDLGKGIKDNENVKRLEQDILKTREVSPIELGEDGSIVDGEHRYKALINLGVTDIPVYRGKQLGNTGRLEKPYSGIRIKVDIPNKVKLSPKSDSSISKELQPLYEEAKKYKSADEFVDKMGDNRVQSMTLKSYDEMRLEKPNMTLKQYEAIKEEMPFVLETDGEFIKGIGGDIVSKFIPAGRGQGWHRQLRKIREEANKSQ